MRYAGILVAVMLAVTQMAPGAAAETGLDRLAPAAGDTGGARLTAVAFPARPAQPDMTPITPVQYGCNRPGALRCINNYVWSCRCFAYGCQWFPSNYNQIPGVIYCGLPPSERFRNYRPGWAH